MTVLFDALRIAVACAGLLGVAVGGALYLATRRAPDGEWQRTVSADAKAARAIAWALLGGSGCGATLAIDQALRVGDGTVTWRLAPTVVFTAALVYGVTALALRGARKRQRA